METQHGQHEQKRTGFLEEAPGVKSSSRLVMVAVAAALIGCYVYSQATGKPMPDLSWETVALLLVGMGVKDIRYIIESFKR